MSTRIARVSVFFKLGANAPDILQPRFVLCSEGGKGSSLETKLKQHRQTGAAHPEGAIDIAGIFSRHAKTVYRLCYSYLASPQDAEDATQAVFMKLVTKPRDFEDAGHEKAWLLVVAANHCKDVLKSAERARAAEMPADVADLGATAETSDVMEAVLALPPQYKDCVYLHYYEGYKTDEIAKMTETPPSTVRNRLRDARAMLKRALEA